MASGDALLFFTAHDAELPVSGNGLEPAVRETILTAPSPVGPVDVIDVLGMPDDAAYSGQWSAVMPQAYSGGGIRVEVMWVTLATTGRAFFDTWFNKLDVGVNLITNGWFGGQSGSDLAPAVARDIIRSTIDHDSGAQMGNLVAGDFFRFNIRRDAPGPPNSVTGDIQFISALLSEL
jgi:hypothetical protein